MLVLGIESSCDETAAAVLEDSRRLLSSVVASQEQIHALYGGVVPEIASRNHVAAVIPVIEKALHDAGVDLGRIDGIAVTRGPGLIGSLLVGLSTAKAIAFARNIPFVGVHHIEGHMAAALLGEATPEYPMIGLVVSGGHTNLYKLPVAGIFQLIGQSRDDAAGEAFDKVGKLLGLGFPGGPAIERAAGKGRRDAVRFPRASLPGFDFSFSGVKTSVAQWVREHGLPEGKGMADLTASFQEAVVDVLVSRLFEAADMHGIRNLVVAGGVARNRRIRERLEQEATKWNARLHLTPFEFCTDNAAMIAAAGTARLKRGDRDDLTLNAQATMPIPP
ncbi:MAG: tRNA (adenosine(37)-N6)-threonylcarbamoyltransferase complex transferase subunit TsaD [Pseudomonadota bacterium]